MPSAHLLKMIGRSAWILLSLFLIYAGAVYGWIEITLFGIFGIGLAIYEWWPTKDGGTDTSWSE